MKKNERLILSLLAFGCVLAGVMFVEGNAGAAERYQYYLAGNPENVEHKTSGLIVMQGGGDEVERRTKRIYLPGTERL